MRCRAMIEIRQALPQAKIFLCAAHAQTDSRTSHPKCGYKATFSLVGSCHGVADGVRNFRTVHICTQTDQLLNQILVTALDQG